MVSIIFASRPDLCTIIRERTRISVAQRYEATRTASANYQRQLKRERRGAIRFKQKYFRRLETRATRSTTVRSFEPTFHQGV